MSDLDQVLEGAEEVTATAEVKTEVETPEQENSEPQGEQVEETAQEAATPEKQEEPIDFQKEIETLKGQVNACLLYTSPSPRD